MSTINIEGILPSNRRIAHLINDIGYLICRENINVYKQIVIQKLSDRPSQAEERDFLIDLYLFMINKLKEII